MATEPTREILIETYDGMLRKVEIPESYHVGLVPTANGSPILVIADDAGNEIAGFTDYRSYWSNAECSVSERRSRREPTQSPPDWVRLD